RAAEIAAANRGHRYRLELRIAEDLTIPLVVQEEERAVALDRAAQTRAVLIQLEGRLRGVGAREKVARVQTIIAQELEQRAAGLRGHDDNRSDAPPVLGSGVVGQKLELLNALDCRPHDERLRDHLRVVDTVEQYLIRLAQRAVGLQCGSAGPQLIGTLAGVD